MLVRHQSESSTASPANKKFLTTSFDSLGLVLHGSCVRHPLSFLAEAADDICYRVLDLEDAAELRIISETRIRDIFNLFLADPLPRHDAIVANPWKRRAESDQRMLASIC